MLTYLLYAVLIIVLAVSGWYIGAQWQYREVGAVVGGLVGAGFVYWHSTSGSSYSF